MGTNNASVVFQLQYKNTKALFTGDAEWSSLKEMEDYGAALRSHILKVGHHGSWNGTTASFLSKVQPEYAVISCGEFNKFNHPSPLVIADLIRTGAEVFRTDRQGAVILEADAKGIHRIR